MSKPETTALPEQKQIRFKPPALTGDAYVDDCFSINFTEEREKRIWSRIEGLKDVPGLVKQNRLEDAWFILDANKDAFRDFDFIYAWKAVIFQKTGQNDAARKTLISGLKRSKEKFLLCDRLGFLEYETGDLNLAVKWWIKSIVAMIGINAVTMWEPFIYLAYVANICGSRNRFKFLMAQVERISVHGELSLEETAVKKLQEKAPTLSVKSVLKAIDCLCDNFIAVPEIKKPEEPPSSSLADLSASKRDTGILRKKGKMPWLLLLAAGGLILVFLFFFFSRPEKTDPAIPEPDIAPAAKAADTVPETITAPVLPEKEPAAAAAVIVPEKEAALAIPEKAPEVETRKEPDMEPAADPVQHKEKHPYLKVKTKTPNPVIKKKE